MHACFAAMLKTQYHVNMLRSVRNLLLLLLVVPPGLLGAQQVEGDVLLASGVYAGELKGQEIRVWASALSTSRPAFALLLFAPAEEQATRERMHELAADPARALDRVCAQVERVEQGYMYHRGYTRVWQSGGGIALVRWQGHDGEALPGSWERLKARPRSSLLETDEYPRIKDKEYAFKQIHRDPRSGKLTKIQLTRTGYIQNPFDNPQTQLKFIGPLPNGDLLGRYLDAKKSAAQVFFKDSDGGELPRSILPACAPP